MIVNIIFFIFVNLSVLLKNISHEFKLVFLKIYNKVEGNILSYVKKIKL